MAYDPAALDSALAAAVGDDPALQAELRGAFFTAAEAHIVRLENAQDAAGWADAARRLRSLATSFGALRIADVAAQAGRANLGDARTVARIRRALMAIRHDAHC